MPAYQIRFLIHRRPRLVAIARNRIATQVRVWGTVLDPATADTLDLLVSELVTNAVLHADGLLITVGVQLERGRLRIEVDDDSAVPPNGPANDPLDDWENESGRGVQLIGALAAGHGWEPLHRGKRVWFELLVTEPTRARARAALLRQAVRAVRRDPAGRCSPSSEAILVDHPRSTTWGDHLLHEWQDFANRLHDAGHQLYCLMWT